MKRAYTNGILLDGTEQMEPVRGKVLLTENDKITAIADASVSLDGYEVIDLHGGYLCPGLINLHVHLAGNGKPSAKPRDNAALVRKIAENYKLPYYTISPTYSICKEHGYIAGEHFTCPHCGKEAEVYSRITGYYRPVQNWNDGKTQEYKNRQLYDIENSCLKKVHSSIVTVSGEEVTVEPVESIKYLFTTKTCPNCKLVKEYLKNVPYVTIDAEENMELARRYGVMQAPTLVVVNGDSHKKYVNASNIKKYVDQLTLVGVE